MGWVRISDDFYDHPAHVELDLDCWGLWVWSLAWSNRNLTDGIIPRAVVRRMDPEGSAIRALVDAGRWIVRDDGAYEIHGYLEFQPSAKDVQAKREAIRAKRAEAGGKGAANRWQTDGKAIANPSQTDSPNPNPNSPNGERARKRASLPQSFAIDDTLRAWGAEKAPGVDLDRELEGWLLWCAANGKKFVDHRAAFQTWCRRAVPKPNNNVSTYRQPDPARAVLGRGVDAAPIFDLDDQGRAVPRKASA